ncbi:MAG: virulence factor Mce family protein, partial [Solirubrobacterales bacterium]|nr:virulence factor Mce family protein [Solirubrobacterales bacterium]
MTKRSLRRDLPLLAAFGLICLASFIVLFMAGGGRVTSGGGYKFQAVLPTAVALVPNADVRMSGVRVGRISAVSTRAGNAVVALDIAKKYAPIYRDARASVRLKSLVGENYVEITPGTRKAGSLPQNGILPLRNADD